MSVATISFSECIEEGQFISCMGSLFHILDINEDDIMDRKVAHKRHVGGLDAPRNSLELQMETSYGLYSARDNILYAHHMANESSDMDYYLTEAPIKNLISEEISKKSNTRQNAPSVVARLMGVDMLPFGSKLVDKKNGNPTGKLMNKKPSEKQQLEEVDSFGHYMDTYPDHCNSHVKSNKHKPREHPQEEELQKFKKEFEAWQAARFQECANFVKVNSSGPAQLIAQEDLNREKMYLYANSKRTTNIEASKKPNDHKLDIVSGPTNIVILKPGPESMDISEDSWNTTTPSTSEDRGAIEDFLEEVKERLKSELQGKCLKTRTSSIRGGGIETPYREKPLEMKLHRSESTRSYRSDFQLESPELFISRDTRRLLAERLRNVLKREANTMVVRNSSRLSMSDYDEQSEHNNWIDNKLEKQSRSFRREHDDEGGLHLIRSLSAPVSGTSFGKLLLEDRHVLTGAQIRRKHEVVEKASLNIKKQKKDKFNIREKVSSFRYSLTLRGRLFRRRVKSVEGFDQNRNNIFLRDIRSGPTIMTSFYEAHENSTEVPPSPASVCSSSVHDEYWRQAEYLSPISSTGGHQLEDNEMSHVFREINSNLNELRRKIDQLDGAVPEETIKEEHFTEAEVDIKDQTEAYVRDLLVAAGLYDGSFSQSLSKWDPLGKPISTQVFEEVEGTYNNESTKVDDERYRKDGEKLNRKMILDLLNELLPALLGEPVNISSSLRKSHKKPPCGRKLLSRVWSIIRVHVYPAADRSYFALDNVLAQDLKPTVWSILIDDDVNAIGRDIECQIIGDMIYEVVKDMC